MRTLLLLGMVSVLLLLVVVVVVVVAVVALRVLAVVLGRKLMPGAFLASVGSDGVGSPRSPYLVTI